MAGCNRARVSDRDTSDEAQRASITAKQAEAASIVQRGMHVANNQRQMLFTSRCQVFFLRQVLWDWDSQ